jgi:hypothetical protein
MLLHNSNPANKWKMGVNKYSDLSIEERRNLYPLTAMQNCSATALLTLKENRPRVNIS